jgi:ribosomal protein S27AE
MPLEAFDENSTCPKCGGRDVSMSYCTDTHAAGEYSSEVTTEHMHRRCNRCGYEWLQATLDAGVSSGTLTGQATGSAK